ncbi:MAG: Lrp/AsnC ligand binding domain-containing protein [Candidatus Nitrosocosmicus sp.]|jgi:DNA-binding Lrp family transcriptional regulator|uniref:Lrp/AsnC family transcriptional regulator n=1 Tax=Candidatus Nitrosocosmicus agrestis TaxID=2563600 RepID=UPI00122E8566|nr:Lrp/AsnC family transcriptional regulator [Candidatus Nitrosocosmicus sp. SS]KAA2283434.1 Lrp/AsnC family transcriptional regulator [Candidatus Nitrosocosmicus sp. SS]KAF0868920.1 Lrp/AsnC family transcriptional regulator [Candidatus Nitrosocosmicus sp. SS]MDR4492101.1 Lrp/AsnC family transcriptional regulator [Candidatus Nitrosocosmicus sp.]HET6589784.1 Lrp/AsnC family transcriptional regulator [Candidatus Nitrosocosmicus sp.]
MNHNAFVLINCTLGAEAKVMQQIQDLEYVEKAYRVYGVYDIIVKINANDKEDLQRKVLLIRRLDEIKSTLTLLQINSTG